jgi:bile acid:Na+ symporter, BASS family
MDRITGDLYNTALYLALWMTGVGLGLSSNIAGFVAPLRNTRILTILAGLDLVAIPLVVWALTHAFDVSEHSATGLLLVGIASAGPVGITACRIAGGDGRAAVAYVLVLEAANAVAIPVWAALLLPSDVNVPIGQLLATLIGLVLAPLAVGIGLRAWRGPQLQRWSAPLARLANLLVLVIVVLVLARYAGDLGRAARDGVVAVAVITVAVALVAGWTAAASSDTPLRIVVALVSAIRANGLALAIARSSFPNQSATQTAVVTFGLISVVVPVAIAYLAALPRRGRPFGANPRAD